ncbi:hypothetical protein P691DRAFT_762772 [Macrolepiota fuliginosa MF-IS2]|uniref:F-box domain-containing protein n=1 Tax=Macrolepiota fuliginosa MF-IS2 TaxID=1400762 RepID=A0A9P5X5Z7_9AGAR|nr:hypothetical protein P691DRAFT_762772 [Macrolepiota fuliginosa MF-IS2]
MTVCPESPTVHTDRVPFQDTSSENGRLQACVFPEQQESFDEGQFQALQLQERVNSSLTKLVKVEFLNLPPEILTDILLYLPFTAVVICQSVNRYLRALISESVKLQYHIHLNVFGQLDNPHCNLPVSERLNQLLSRERRWKEFKFDFDRITKVPVVAPYERLGLSGEALSLSYADGVSWRVGIPREADQEIKWKRLEICARQTLAKMHVREHDLLFLITV